jgi:hypothetical protein
LRGMLGAGAVCVWRMPQRLLRGEVMKRAVIVLFVAAACGGGGSSTKEDAALHDAGVDAPADASCFTNPQTHNEIINACTDAQKIYKASHPPLLKPDGTLPALPP